MINNETVNREDIDTLIKQKLQYHFSKIFDIYAKCSPKTKQFVINRMTMNNILSKADIFEQTNNYFLIKSEFDEIFNELYPTVKEIDLKLFTDILLVVIKIMYGNIYIEHPYNAVLAFIDKFELNEENSVNLDKKTFAELSKEKMNDEVKKVFESVSHTFKEIYKFYIESLYMKKEKEIYEGIVRMCRNFKIFPFIIKQSEFDIYYTMYICNKQYFSFDNFITFIFHISILYSQKKGESKIQNSVQIKNLLFYLHETNYLETFISILHKGHLNLTFLPPLYHTQNIKTITESNKYVELIKANFFKLKQLFLLYTINNSLLDLQSMNYSTYLKFIFDLGLIRQKKNYPSSLSTIERKSALSTMSVKDSINQDNSTTCYTHKAINFSISKEEITLLFNQITRNKIFLFDHFIVSIEKIIQRLNKNKSQDIKLYQNFLQDVIFPFMHRKKTEFKKKYNVLYTITSKNKFYNNYNLFSLFKDIFNIFYLNYCDNRDMISLKKFVLFFQHFSFVPLFVNVELLKLIFVFFLFENNTEIATYEISFEDFVHSLMLVALLYEDNESGNDQQKIYFFIEFFDKIRKEKNIILTNKETNINYNHNDIHRKISMMIKKIYKVVSDVNK